ncbi:MAG: nicotinate-nicotinamide nucleotide adenylyltransferase, partial [Deltaproteobacteria bacterium]|nr:nicotinate-nicotinamide nucleotide adenylyltransferase [Deltaproteobacteria bacterium]
RIFGSDAEVFFILGMDAFMEIRTWKEYEHLFDYAHFVIIGRPGFETDSLKDLLLDLGAGIDVERDGPDLFTAPSGKTVRRVSTTLMDISSTRIREMVRENKSIRFLVPEKVGNYIANEGLYR